jgi:general secretion pathway protein J
VRGGGPAAARGFTLLEVLVSLTLLTVIVGALFGVLRLSSRSWEAAQARSDESGEARVALDFLRLRVTEMLPRRWRQGNEERLAFAGDAEALRFIAPAPVQHAGVGLYEFLLRIEARDGRTRLDLRYEPYHPGATEFAASPESPGAVLLDGLESASLSFYGAEREKAVPEWTRAWDPEADYYPRLIRLDLRPAGPGEPELALQYVLRSDPAAGG